MDCLARYAYGHAGSGRPFVEPQRKRAENGFVIVQAIFMFLGLNLAVFRGEDGRAHVVDAYCPHLGAHLAVGGAVIGDCIQCPFHGWEFNGDTGKCTHIPTTDRSK